MTPKESASSVQPLVAIEVPQLGESVSEVDIVQLFVAPGDLVQAEQNLVELGSHKANMPITAPVAGRITECCVHVGQQVTPGTKLFMIDPSVEVLAPAQKLHEPIPADNTPTPVEPVIERHDAPTATRSPSPLQRPIIEAPARLRPYGAEQIAQAKAFERGVILVQSIIKISLNGDHPGKMPHLAHVITALTKAMVHSKQSTTYGWPCGHHHPHGFVPDDDIRIGLVLPDVKPMRSICLRELDSKNAIGHRSMLEHAMTAHPVPADLEPAGVTLVFLRESGMMVFHPLFPMTSLTIAIACAPKPFNRRRASLRVSLTADVRACTLRDPESFMETFSSALLQPHCVRSGFFVYKKADLLDRRGF